MEFHLSTEIESKLQEPLDDEERWLMDPETWDWDSVEYHEGNPNSGVVLGVRFSLEEMTRVGEAAAAEGVPIYEYIKESALRRSLEIVNR